MSLFDSRVARWQLRTRTLEFGPLPTLMGILNVTPDSFSDGGRYFSRQSAVDQALRLEDAGAGIIDIGGESTRPYSVPVSQEEELSRVIPVIESLQGRLTAALSIDTSKSIVAQAAIDVGAEIVNDVTGLDGDVKMLGIIAHNKVGVCVMHMQGTPQTMQDRPEYGDVIREIREHLSARDSVLVAGGVDPSRICLDPGIGFGKTHEHNWSLVRGCGQFLTLGRPILIGHSRKGFIRKLCGDKSGDVVAGSVGVALAVARYGVQILRVHDVKATHDALRTFAESGGIGQAG